MEYNQSNYEINKVLNDNTPQTHSTHFNPRYTNNDSLMTNTEETGNLRYHQPYELQNKIYPEIFDQNSIDINSINMTGVKNVYKNNLNKINNTNNSITNTEKTYSSYTNNTQHIRKNKSQINMKIQKSFNNLDEFLCKITLTNYYSAIEILKLIDEVAEESNFDKNYEINVKGSLITLIFYNADEGMDFFKKLSIEKLKNNYFNKLNININIISKNDLNETKNTYKLPKLRNNKTHNKLGKLYKASSTAQSQINVCSNKIYENFKERSEKFDKREKERKKKVLKDIMRSKKTGSILANSPYIDTKNFFKNCLRESKGKFISPARFNGFIGKASIEKDKNFHKNEFLFGPCDFENHWELRKDDRKKWVSPAKFFV